ncbi:sulfatase-like hydrolase/transferase [Persicirhabdus sediminis]|uniref:Sulfatase-like hydrolase/transferase n=1 Tax=Persicirhabdus sediminis TaxID=454144 RepID=A0A8J7MC07_9BACT|nr:sulfatase-like hydrolase/transferase [Persicirhabdus sediminis]MBK1790283.1 sulfatase-like hydrolase/transferase [Persicirhabdus sediminis]
MSFSLRPKFRHLSSCLLLAFSASSQLTTAAESEQATQPNVIIFLIDDMGLMDTSVPFITDKQGQPEVQKLNEYYHTPAMEMLASRGHRFETFYANSVCSPSRISIMTGQSSARHHSSQWINPRKRNEGPADWQWDGITAEKITLPKVLKPAGYNTYHVGKAHFGNQKSPASDPTFIGFDVNIGGNSIGRPDSYYGEKNYGKGLYQVPNLEAYHGTNTHLSDALTIEACKLIDSSVDEKKPFFLHFAHYALHAPFQPDPRYVDKYANDLGSEMPAYASLVEGMDKSLGDLITHLEKIGQAENTLIFFLGDNGSDAPVDGRKGDVVYDIGSSAPLRGRKGTYYEGGMRVPFIAAWAKPNLEHPIQKNWPIAQNAITHKSAGFASIEDLFPTITTLAGASSPADHKLDGNNILPALAEANTASPRTSFLMHFPHEHRSSEFTVYRKGAWKLVYHYNKPAAEAYELFNLLEDTSEDNNLANSQPEKLKSMAVGMLNALDDADAQFTKDKPKLP